MIEVETLDLISIQMVTNNISSTQFSPVLEGVFDNTISLTVEDPQVANLY